ncbi:hypothetical protein [Phenylobacterium sp.]|uniref:hypothetical protein n=1 Tax=Phenylobacterium sp. TaxID=1871053 RepID=UPI00286C0E34|nr:hypothetical protein [Phenylobacterium sp.]
MISPPLAIGFGLVAISMLFLVVVFFRAWRDPDDKLDRRYRVVSGALMVWTAGAALWSYNPLSQSLGWPGLDGISMFVASVLLFLSSATLIGSTVLNGSRLTVAAYIVSSMIWIFGCLLFGYIL